MELPDYTAVYASIVVGHLDDRLTDVENALRERVKIRAAEFVRTLRPGAVVRFNKNTHPRYLVGLTGEVVEVKRSKAVVKMNTNDGAPRYPEGSRVNVPGALLELA